MGEAGTKAILPLARGSDCRLGVAGRRWRTAVAVDLNVSTPDATSFRKSQAQITIMVARAAARPPRALDGPPPGQRGTP